MNDQTPHPDDRLERTLRRWGAETAARRENVGLFAPSPAAPSGAGMWGVLRGLAIAAAAVIVFAAGMFAVRMLSPSERPIINGRAEGPTTGAAVGADAPPLKAELARLATALASANQTLAGVRSELTTAREDLDKARAEASTQAAEHAREIAKLKTDFQAQLAGASVSGEQVKQLQGRIDALSADLTAARQQAADAEKTLAQALKDAAAARTSAKTRDDELARLDLRLTAATSELKRVTEAMQRNADASREAAKELAAMKAGQAAVMARFRDLYLSAAAPELRGVAAQQAAARRGHLLRRTAAARAAARSEDTRRVLDRVETVLTRLDLLRPDDPRDAEAFARLAGGNLLEEIDAALAAGEAPGVQGVLLEARLILTEGDHAG